MSLKYSISELFKGKFPNPHNIYEQLKDLQEQINQKTYSRPVVKRDVKLNKTNLKKAFGDPKSFDYLGVVHNAEGSYLIIADEQGHWLHYSLDEV